MYSTAKIVKSVYPDHQWRDWKFTSAPRHSAMTLATEFRLGKESAIASVAELMNEIAQQQHIQKLDDWYSVSRQQLGQYGFLINALGKLPTILGTLYPDHPWKWNRSKISNKLAMHKLAGRMLQQELKGR